MHSLYTHFLYIKKVKKRVQINFIILVILCIKCSYHVFWSFIVAYYIIVNILYFVKPSLITEYWAASGVLCAYVCD